MSGNLERDLEALVTTGFLERRVAHDGTVLYRVSEAGAREMERERAQAIVDSFTARLEGENAILESLL